MHQLSYYYLILRFPTLRKYINQCYLSNQHDQLYDFLFALETDNG